MTLRVPGANGTASHRGRNASTPTSAFALHENEQPPPFPARSTNSPSCLLLLPPPSSLLRSFTITLASTTPISVPSVLHRMSVYRFISPNLFPFAPSQIHLFALAPFYFYKKFATVSRFLPLRVSLSLSLRPLNHRIRLIPYDARGNFRKNITFPRTIRSIPREKYNLFPCSHSDYRRAFSIPLPR